MTLPMRAAAHLVVLAAALIAAGTRPAGPGPATVGAAAALTYRPPAFAAALAQPAHRDVARSRHRTTPARTHRVVRNAAAVTATAVRPATRPARTAPRRRPVAHHRHRYVAGPTGWSALNTAIARIPTYRAGAARWLVSSKYGHWGTADWYHDVLYVAPGVPDNRLYDVAVHEWSHELSVLDYAGDVSAAVRAMNAWFGGSGLAGAERAADCMSILQGATWTHYTACTDARWRAGAARLVSGRRL